MVVDPRGREGVFMVLVSGILVLLGMVALIFARGAGLSAGSGARQALRVRSGLLAESGLAYASARLLQTTVVPGALGRADDWSARGENEADLPADRLSNPSYARGEPWHDADGDGRYDSGEDWTDLDGDGRFSAWSGRLRQAAGVFADKFSLRIRSDAGLVPINAGELGNPAADHDRDGVPNRIDPEYQAWLAVEPSPWNDPDASMNLTLVNLLDSLGALLGVSDAASEEYTPAAGNWPATPGHRRILLSRLGRRIVSARPRGGYEAVADLRDVLGASDYAKVAPYLTVAGDRAPRNADVVDGHVDAIIRPAGLVRDDQPLVDLNAAPVQVIQASLRIAAAAGTYHFDPTAYDPSPEAEFQVIVTESPHARILEAEAAAIAARIDQERRVVPIRSWRHLLDVLSDFSDVQDDPFTVTDEASGPARQERLLLLQDLVLAAFNPNVFVPDPFSRSRDTLESDRLEGTSWRTRRVPSGALVGFQTAPYLYSGQAATTGVSLYMPTDLFAPPPPDPDRPTPAQLKTRPSAFFDLGGGPRRYEAVSEGVARAGALDGRRTARAALDFPAAVWRATGQEDFEMTHPAAGTRAYGDGGIVYDGAIPPARAGVQSHPRFPLTSYALESLLADFPHMTESQREDLRKGHVYPAAWGDLRLAARQLPVGELLESDPPCVFALPFNEDGASGPHNRYSADDWEDNFGDPARRPDGAPAAQCFHARGGAAAVAGGARFGPSGLRLFPLAFVSEETGEPEDRDYLAFLWGDASAPAPLSRGDYHDPDNPENVVPRGGEIRHATIAFVFPTRGGETPVPQYGDTEFEILFESLPAAGSGDEGTSPAGDRGGMGGGEGGGEEEGDGEGLYEDDRYFRYIGVRVIPGDVLGIFLPNGGSSVVSPPPLSDASGRRWRHVAIVIDGGDDAIDGVAQARVWIDGVFCTPTPILLDVDAASGGRKPGSDVLRLKLLQGPLDDLKFFDVAMSEPQIQAEAERALRRHETFGMYLSGLLTFDRGRFPDGARIAGATWDAFVPAVCRAIGTPSMRFTVYAYGEDRTAPPLGQASFDWDGDPESSQEAVFRLPPCRHFRWQVDMFSAHPYDTPVLDAFHVLLARPGAPWVSYAAD